MDGWRERRGSLGAPLSVGALAPDALSKAGALSGAGVLSLLVVPAVSSAGLFGTLSEVVSMRLLGRVGKAGLKENEFQARQHVKLCSVTQSTIGNFLRFGSAPMRGGR
jgi:hypothetical protein